MSNTMINTKMMLVFFIFMLVKAHAECDMSAYIACQNANLEETLVGRSTTQCEAEQLVTVNTFACLEQSECCAMQNDFMPPQSITEVQGRCPNFRVPVCGNASFTRSSRVLLMTTLLLFMFGL